MLATFVAHSWVFSSNWVSLTNKETRFGVAYSCVSRADFLRWVASLRGPRVRFVAIFSLQCEYFIRVLEYCLINFLETFFGWFPCGIDNNSYCANTRQDSTKNTSVITRCEIDIQICLDKFMHALFYENWGFYLRFPVNADDSGLHEN